MKIVDLALFRTINLMAATFTPVSCIRRCHVYKDVWDPILGESVCCECEDRSPQDPYAAQSVIFEILTSRVFGASSLCDY